MSVVSATIPTQTFDMVMQILADRSEIEFRCREKAFQERIIETERRFQSIIIRFLEVYRINVHTLRLGSQNGDEILDSLRILKLSFPVDNLNDDERNWEERALRVYAFNHMLEKGASTLDDIDMYEIYLDLYLDSF